MGQHRAPFTAATPAGGESFGDSSPVSVFARVPTEAPFGGGQGLHRHFNVTDLVVQSIGKPWENHGKMVISMGFIADDMIVHTVMARVIPVISTKKENPIYRMYNNPTEITSYN